ncbi:MAG: transcription termination factor Rho [Acidimicrobiales bacterium]|jgi:transcription termination factor Rho
MSGEQLERSILERKEREELKAIATAMSLEPVARVKKADLVDQILRAAGVEVGAESNGSNGGPAAPPASSPEGEPSVMHAGQDLDASTNGKVAKPRAARGRSTKAKAAAADDAVTSEAGSAEDTAAVHDGADTTSPAHTAVDRSETASDTAGEGGVPDGATAADTAEQAGRAGEQGDAASTVGNGSGTVTGAARFIHDDALSAQGPVERQERPDRNDRNNHDRSNQQQNRHQRPQQGNQGNQIMGGGGQGQNQSQNQAGQGDAGNRRSRRRRGRDRTDRELQGGPQADAPFSGELVPVKGLLDLKEEGYGFLRTSGYLASAKDVYVSVSQARRFSLRRGDAVEGACRPAGPSEKYPALLRIDSINGMTPDEARERPRFEDLTPLFPDERLRLENREDPTNVTARIIDLISPIGKGQRGMIVSPSKAGKTTIMKQIAHSVELNNPSVHLMVLLVDERPEEVTDMRRSVKGEVIASTFDRPADEHTALSELTMERAKRLVEMGRDVVIILDGITRLARAYNLAQPATGRIMSGGVDSGALYPPKKFFGAARNVEEGGSLTILATALIETGSKMDEVIFEEFKGTGNMELRLDRKLAERRIYPAIDVNASSTRHEELLFDRSQLQQVWKLRRVLNALGAEGSAAAGLELLVDKIKTTRSNDEFLAEIAKAPTPSN